MKESFEISNEVAFRPLFEALNKPEYRYVFPLKKDIFNEEYFEFIGIFSLDTDKSTNNKRIWKKVNLGDKVTLNIEDLLKNIAD